MHSLGVEFIDSLASGRYGQFVHNFMPDKTLGTNFYAQYQSSTVQHGHYPVANRSLGPCCSPGVLACVLPSTSYNATSSQDRVSDQHILAST